MNTVQLGLFAIIAYTLAFVCEVASSKGFSWRIWLTFLTWAAIIFHGMQLHLLIDLPHGQNLSWANSLSLLAWLSILLTALASRLFPVSSLNLFIYPVAIIAIALCIFFQPIHLIVTAGRPQTLLHILLATLIVALLLICGIQACLLSLQQFSLKQKKMLSLLELLPALDLMERLFFFEITLGFLGLSLFLLLTLLGFNAQTLISLWAESLFSFILWLLFLVLLIGRYYLKWRSILAARFTSIAVALAIVLYLSSHTIR